MKKKRYFWKVVSDESDGCTTDKYYSALAGGKARVHYEIDKWIRAPDWLAKQGRHLFVFSCLKYAKTFILRNPGIHSATILRCLVKDRVYPKHICQMALLSIGEITPSLLSDWPGGTRSYKQVKLVKKVKKV